MSGVCAAIDVGAVCNEEHGFPAPSLPAARKHRGDAHEDDLIVDVNVQGGVQVQVQVKVNVKVNVNVNVKSTLSERHSV